jgi:anti-anti-sigma factor
VEINEHRDGEVVVLGPVGRIDNDTSAAFQSKLLAAVAPANSAVLVDLGGVDYISSAGLRVLLMAAKQSKATHGRLAVAALRPVVKEIFEISRFSHIVPIFGTAAEAVAAIG